MQQYSKIELQEWLKHPVTQGFQEAIRLEAQESKADLAKLIDSTDMDKDTLFVEVLSSKVERKTYAQFTDDNAKDTIIAMFDDHNLLEDEEETNDSN